MSPRRYVQSVFIPLFSSPYENILFLLCKGRPLPQSILTAQPACRSSSICSSSYLSTTPRRTGQNVRWEIHQAAGLLACAHGSLTPPRFSPSRPKTEVSLSPSPGHGRRRVQPGICSRFVPLPMNSCRHKKVLQYPFDHGEPLLGSLGKSRIRMCLMKCIFSCQSAHGSNFAALKSV